MDLTPVACQISVRFSLDGTLPASRGRGEVSEYNRAFFHVILESELVSISTSKVSGALKLLSSFTQISTSVA